MSCENTFYVINNRFNISDLICCGFRFNEPQIDVVGEGMIVLFHVMEYKSIFHAPCNNGSNIIFYCFAPIFY